MDITLEELKAELALSQITMSDAMLTRLMARIAKFQPCFDEHGYDEATVYMIYVYLITLLSLFGQDGRVRSQGAPSGASRSFFFAELGQRWRALRDLLNGLDPAGCISGLIPPDPDNTSNCALWISPGPGGCISYE